MTTDPADRRPIPARRLAAVKGIARALAAAGVPPNAVSGFGLAVGLLAGACLALTGWFPGAAPALWLICAACVFLRGLSNVFDGLLAVEHGAGTRSGLLWNEVPDRVSDIALMAGAGYSLGGSALAGWLCACLALLVAFVRVVAREAGAPADFRGPFAKQQRMFSVAAVAALLALAPPLRGVAWGPQGAWGLMAAWLWVMVPGMVLTIALRLRRASRALAARPDPADPQTPRAAG